VTWKLIPRSELLPGEPATFFSSTAPNRGYGATESRNERFQDGWARLEPENPEAWDPGYWNVAMVFRPGLFFLSQPEETWIVCVKLLTEDLGPRRSFPKKEEAMAFAATVRHDATEVTVVQLVNGEWQSCRYLEKKVSWVAI
jgi:hypothetical protein